jgi:hypothetical protein
MEWLCAAHICTTHASGVKQEFVDFGATDTPEHP